jgi:predicted DNA-binding protein
MVKNNKNYTFLLPIEILDRLKTHAENGQVASVNSAVREAIEAYVVEVDKKYLYEQMKEAADNQAFMDDLTSAMGDFSDLDHEALQEKKL